MSVSLKQEKHVVADTTKVRIFKQITTDFRQLVRNGVLLLIPQRYEFSSKSQLFSEGVLTRACCCWYHKGTNFQANHNCVQSWSCKNVLLLIPQRYEFSSKSQHKVRNVGASGSCCWYHKGTNFQANHNYPWNWRTWLRVVADTTKVRIFKQITTVRDIFPAFDGCCWYHKGTNFQANHNAKATILEALLLLLIPQRYEFSSKSQQEQNAFNERMCCCWYHKGTNFQANHNRKRG